MPVREALWLNTPAMATTTDILPPVSYTTLELASYLPAGWTLADEPAPAWDDAKGAWRCTVIDLCDLDWQLVVPQKEVAAHGRIEALRRAVDQLDRKRFKSWL